MIEVLGVSIVLFIACLYLPAAVFRFGAEQYIDLTTKTDGSELEEFIASTIPSLSFHGLTWLLLRLVSVIERRPMPVVNWEWFAGIIADEHKTYVFDVVANRPMPTVIYFGCCLAVSFGTGLMYGRSVLDLLRESIPSAPVRPPALAWAASTKLERAKHGLVMVWFYLRRFGTSVSEAMFALNYKVANAFYHEGILWAFRWAVRKPTLSVRTRNGFLYFGKFDSYTKRRSGDIEAIVITEVWKYWATEMDPILAEGRLPFAYLGGSLSFRWAEVTDAHVVNPEHFEEIRQRQMERRAVLKASEILELCGYDGETLTLEEVFLRQSRGDWSTRELVFEALEKLTHDRIVNLKTSADGMLVEGYIFPTRPRHAAVNHQQQEPSDAPFNTVVASRNPRRLRMLRQRFARRTIADRRLSPGYAEPPVEYPVDPPGDHPLTSPGNGDIEEPK